jgi:bacteriocin biosynthesis cyclodehydratase domain-containing protein
LVKAVGQGWHKLPRPWILLRLQILPRDSGKPLMLTGDDRDAVSESGGGDVLRFVPNLSVYVLPPDTVCLYSEHRKFFLRGKLYCALSARLGAGEPRDSIVRALSGEFPAAEIEQALERLLDRGFIFSPGPVDGPLAGYWASLGLAPETAAENVGKIGVGIEPCGNAGGNELSAALRELGVRIVERSADLIVVLASDYLDQRLAELNRRFLAAKQDWLLVQPAGIFPLVGPILRPGQGACWMCLADRMASNRQIKAFIERKQANKQAQCLAAAPLAETMLGDSAVALAAVEIAKAIASGFGTDLRDHLVSLDLLGSTVARHYVAARPQCPACGRAELRDAQRTPAPPRLRAGGKLIMTGGGYRAVAPAVTVARFRKHVSPLTGAVAQLERVATDLPLNASYVARHSFSPRPETVDALRAALSGSSYGKGNSADEAEASALMGAIERYCGLFQGNEIRTVRRFADFPTGDVVPVNDILLRSDAGFDPSAEIEWSPVWSLRDERFKYAPTGLLYYFHAGEGGDRLSADSSGCAAGNTLEEAIVHGFLELVERDASAIWWYNRLRRPEIDIAALGDGTILDLRAQLAAGGRRLWLIDITSDLAIPTVVAVSHWTEEAREHVALGAGAHFDRRIAALRAVSALNLRMVLDTLRGARAGPEATDGGDPLPLQRHAYLRPHGKAARPRASSLPNFAGLDRREQVLACVKAAGHRGLDVLVLDQTRPDLEIPVARVIVPGLRHLGRRLAPGRLYDVPVALGLRKRPSREAELNPLDPPT